MLVLNDRFGRPVRWGDEEVLCARNSLEGLGEAGARPVGSPQELVEARAQGPQQGLPEAGGLGGAVGRAGDGQGLEQRPVGAGGQGSQLALRLPLQQCQQARTCRCLVAPAVARLAFRNSGRTLSANVTQDKQHSEWW